MKEINSIKAQYLSHWEDDIDLASAAWASTVRTIDDIESKNEEDVSRVVKIIVDGHHDTPKESIWVKFYIECPIFVERQFDKYRMTQQYQDIHIDNNLKEELDKIITVINSINKKDLI